MAKYRWDILSEYILINKFSSFVEIGTAAGLNIRNVLSIIGNNYPIKIWCIDPYVPYGKDSNGTPGAVKSNFKSMKNTIFKDNRVTHIRDFSLNVVKSFKNNSVDIIFIDANHTKEMVYKDIISWCPKVKAGGILAGHDYRKNTKRVKGAVDQFVDETGVVVDIKSDAVWVIKK